MYEGDSIIRPGPDVQPGPSETGVTADSTPEMVRRRIATPAIDPRPVDRFEIERRARALRAETMHAVLVSFWGWVNRSTETARRRRAEAYLARAQSIPELEARIHKLERTGRFAGA